MAKYSVKKSNDTTINWFEVCHNIPLDLRKSEWCVHCNEGLVLSETSCICRYDKDVVGGELHE